MKFQSPSMDQWLKEAKADPNAPNVGMYLIHNGTVRRTARAAVRDGKPDTAPVTAMEFSYDPEAVEAAVAYTRRMDGIHYVRVWLNQGRLDVGDDIMYILIGADIRPHAVDALQQLVGEIKAHCVCETEVCCPQGQF